MARWGRRAEPVVERGSNGPEFTSGDAALAEFLGWSGVNDSDVAVNEWSALGSSAVYRAVSIVAGLAQLPLFATTATDEDPDPEVARSGRTASVLDNPGGEWFTPFEWRETVYLHLALHGNAYLLRMYNGAGQITALFPIHPSMVTVRWWAGRRQYTVTIPQQSPIAEYTPSFIYSEAEIVHVRGMSGNGLQGYSPIWVLRNMVGTALSGDKAAARTFKNGMLLGGIVSAPGITPEQGKQIKAGLKANMAGSTNAGDLAVVNSALTFSPWTMNAEQAQFIESRKFQVEEVARAWGIPKVLLAEDGASTWGSGIAQLDTGMAKYTFGPYTTRVGSKLSHAVLDGPVAYTDYAAFLRGTPQDQAQLALTLAQAQYYANKDAATESAPLVGQGPINPDDPSASLAGEKPTDPAVPSGTSTGGFTP